MVAAQGVGDPASGTVRRRRDATARRATVNSQASSTRPAPGFDLLLVCAGNICRSPLAEYAIRDVVSRLPSAQTVRVHSAGTIAVPGRPMQPGSASILASVGLNGSGFVSRRVTERDLDADLVLVADREVRGQVAVMYPSVLGRLLTMRQAARLLADVPTPLPGGTATERLAALLPAMHARRGATPLVAPEDDDVLDPYGYGDDRYRLAWSRMKPLFDELARVLGAHR